MTRSRLLISLACLLAGTTFAAANENPLWLRYPAISPDGDQIVFTYGGDLYLVPAEGGDATHFTQHAAHDYLPVWSPDGSSIAFASDRFGNFDVFLAPVNGGETKRLTHHSASDSPSGFHPDGKSVLFSSTRLDSQRAIGFPSGVQPELYSAPIDGTRPVQILTTPAEDAIYSADGSKIAYHDRKGYENAWRKHHTSSIARDLWMYDVAEGSHTQLTEFPGEDRNPVFGRDGTLYYLSEKSGSFNVWRMDGDEPQQVTSFENHPVRFLTASRKGLLSFSYHGELYTLDSSRRNAQPKKVPVTIRTGAKENERRIISINGNATEAALSPNGKELAFVTRGEIFVTSLEHKSTKRITNTPEQERSVSFSPDGRSLLYAGERDESWNLYVAKIARDEEKYFHLATVIEEETLLATPKEEFQPQYSPDGKEVAYLEERTTLRILNLDSNEIRTVLAGDQNYSYSDGDQAFEWSPDSQWLVSGYLGYNRWEEDLALIPVRPESIEQAPEGIVNLSESAYSDWNGQWALGGEAILWFSNRHGMRSHGSWGSQGDVYARFLTRDAYDRFRLSEEEYALLKEEEKDEDKEKDKDKKKDEESEEEEEENGDEEDTEDSDESNEDEESEEDEEKVDPIEIEWVGLDDRKARLTIHSSSLGGAVLTPEGDALYYLSKFEKGYDLWVHKFYEEETKLVTKLPGGSENSRGGGGRDLLITEDGKTLVILDRGSLHRVDVAKGSREGIGIGSEMEVRPADERAYMFEHSWRQLKKKFYVTDLHGVNWDFYKTEYAKFLPHINNNYDFAEMLSEMLGELNASHTGSGHRPRGNNTDSTASLGIFPDHDHDGAGIRILEIIDKSPLKQRESKAAPGVIIEKIDGVEIAAGENYYPLLNRKSGKRTLLSFLDPETDDQWDEVIKPISLGELNNLLYERWIETRAKKAEELSDGRIGYVHVRSMNDESFRRTFDRVLGPENDKEALVVDTRFNGGGWLHDDLVTFLSGKPYLQFYPRGQGNLGGEPAFKWAKPSAVLIGESNYSDAHMFPYAYKAHDVGQLVGMPVPGTATAVWWETLIDSSLYFGIPQVGMRTPYGTLLENTQLEPDVKVMNRPEDVANGEDKQLEAAVKLLMEE